MLEYREKGTLAPDASRIGISIHGASVPVRSAQRPVHYEGQCRLPRPCSVESVC
ncbi:hypothetical protein DOTSEDRAFT_46504 [Dothistroma septosporum NZE10]|uniref:Uncharacterized protein n=1 Tax=Dothistroma septosporum (strain NZE10 / CBS 128990) TaxID=675120 RepID=N1PJM5_DOTSN|nr:hypothetical protein DOTSEDRAFT_46504 [Dothistroma septosporum NZE10]